MYYIVQAGISKMNETKGELSNTRYMRSFLNDCLDYARTRSANYKSEIKKENRL